MILIVFCAFMILIMNIFWHYFEPCNQKYTVNVDGNIDVAAVVDSVLTSNESSMTLCKNGVCYGFSIEKIKDRTFIYALNYECGLGEFGDIYRGRSISEIMQIETCFEDSVLSKLGVWEKHYLQGVSSFLAIKSIDVFLFKWFFYYIIIVFVYFIIYLRIRRSTLLPRSK